MSVAQVLSGERRFHVEAGDCLDVMRGIASDSVDAIVTDCPASISFMGHEWDSDGGDPLRWMRWLSKRMREARRVLKPGGYAFVWAIPRTSDLTGMALRLAGFELRDKIVHLFGSGMPHGLNVTQALDDDRCRCELPDLRRSAQSNAGEPGLGVLPGMRGLADIGREEGKASDPASGLPMVREGVQTEVEHVDSEGALLHVEVQRSQARGGSESPRRSHEDSGARASGVDSVELQGTPGEDDRPEESRLEGRSDLPKGARELQGGAVRPVPGGAEDDGAPGQLHRGTSARDGDLGGEAAVKDGGRAPRQSRPSRKRPKQPGAVAGQQQPQANGAWPTCRGCGKQRVAEGLGTCLKPGVEDWWVVQKPIAERTIARQVLASGTGALNVDACRVTTAKVAKAEALGRYPANLVISHSPSCELVGTRKVKAAPPWNDNRGPSPFTGAATSPVHHSDGDGTETVEDWKCGEGCPVRLLDEQSGKLHATGAPNSTEKNYRKSGYGDFGVARKTQVYLDSGGASRYFNTFPADPFIYAAKASRADRERGLEHLPKNEQGRANEHPTVKSVLLMRHFVRLACQRGGVVLDNFMGSGTTGVACSAEGMRFIGIDLDEANVTVARARIEGDSPLFNREASA